MRRYRHTQTIVQVINVPRQIAVFTIALWSMTAAPVVVANAQTDDSHIPSSRNHPSDTATTDYDPDTDEALFLLVSINGNEIGRIARFALSQETQRMSAQRSDLEDIGISAPRDLGRTIFLDQIPSFSHIYDVPTQSLFITVQGPSQIPVEISAIPQRDLPEPQTGYGLVLNYRATANLGDDILNDGFRPANAFVALDMRAYTPLGVLSSTGSLRSQFDIPGSTRFSRNNTYFTVSGPRRMMTLTAGDFSTSGLAWTRPVRLGGIQIRRDFSLRDDIVTSPLLSYSGTAAVPSSIDVYVDNVRAYSGSVGPGPFNLTDVPMITSGGDAVFVLRDESGNEQTKVVPFFATQNLLSKGMIDFSLEAGHVRKPPSFGHFAYGESTAGTLSLRYGLSDNMTLGFHAENLDRFRMAGLGMDMVIFNSAEVSFAAAASVHEQARGNFLFGAVRTDIAGIGIRMSTRRTFGEYQDLASVTAMENFEGVNSGVGLSAVAAAKAQDALSLIFPKMKTNGRFGLNFINSERQDQTNTILSASFSQPLPGRGASFQANAFKDFAGVGGYGVSAGVSMVLGRKHYASANIRRDRQGRTDAVATVSRPALRTAGSYGYQMQLSPQTRALVATYQSRFGRADMALRDSGQGTHARATFDGALVLAAGGLFATNRVDDGFAVVTVGVPDVPVSLNNREVARTGWFGKALVPDLRSYRTNRISINPLELPLDANIGATAMNVVPARRSGVSVDFGGQAGAAALVVLRDAAGAFLKPGSHVRLHGSQASFFIGYDGEVWIEGLGARNQITVQLDDGTCRAEFVYTAQSGTQVYINEVECR